MSDQQLADLVKYDANGLVPAVIQDDANGDVLMVAYMNADALRKTIETGKTHFYSRSRQKMWLKGEESGHTQTVKSLYVDCDGDCLVVRVDQNVAACHTGYRTCFYRRRAADGGVELVGTPLFDPKKAYKK